VKRETHPASGFTLVELVVVVAIIALLAGILIPVVTSQIDDAKRSRAMGDMDVIAKAFSTFRTHTGMWPNDPTVVVPSAMTTSTPDFVGFPSLYANPQALTGWKGPYLNVGYMNGTTMNASLAPTSTAAGAGMVDPWGQPYRIYITAQTNGAGGVICVASRGPDGTFNSTADQIRNGAPAGDDLCVVISRRL
jgi:general secretion pathway protein G